MKYRAYFETMSEGVSVSHRTENDSAEGLIKNILKLLSELGLAGQVLENLVLWVPGNTKSIVVNLNPDGSMVGSLLGNSIAI